MNGIHWIDTQTRDVFDTNLRRFLRNTFTDENLRDDGLDLCVGSLLYMPGIGSHIRQIRPYKCMYIDFTSLEDVTGKCDVLRCNPDFQVNHEERFDFVNFNMDQNSLSFARVLYLFRCVLPSHREEDIALVRSLKASRWKPNTLWENCRLLDDVHLAEMEIGSCARKIEFYWDFGTRGNYCWVLQLVLAAERRNQAESQTFARV
ncbi:hypothetical protein R3P38DRAFT_2798741 [Favolaschia claudopus]|uniref:Uncharacterized protein n=1 Tax=Favolaschia claudopus TaxID=2862362 RepID=A0AAW0A116_9AGAR